VRPTFAAHCNGIRDSNGVVLPRQHILLLDSIFDGLSKVQHWSNSQNQAPFHLLLHLVGVFCALQSSYSQCILSSKVSQTAKMTTKSGSYLTCTDSLPTTLTLHRRGGNFSLHLGSARPRRIALPCFDKILIVEDASLISWVVLPARLGNHGLWSESTSTCSALACRFGQRHLADEGNPKIWAPPVHSASVDLKDPLYTKEKDDRKQQRGS